MSRVLDELVHQQVLWKRRMTSGQGALQSDRIEADFEPKLVLLAGPIKYWWDEHWMSPLHLRYAAWRTKVSETLVAAGHLVYRPHEAFKGHWTESAQEINDAVVGACDVFVDLTPEGIPAEGTDAERAIALALGKPVHPAPPPGPGYEDFALTELVLFVATSDRNPGKASAT